MLADERRERAAISDRVSAESAAGLQRHVMLLQSLNVLDAKVLSWDAVEQVEGCGDGSERAMVKGCWGSISDSPAALVQECGSETRLKTQVPLLELSVDEFADWRQGRMLVGKCEGHFEELRTWVKQQCGACHEAVESLSTLMTARLLRLEAQSEFGRSCVLIKASAYQFRTRTRSATVPWGCSRARGCLIRPILWHARFLSTEKIISESKSTMRREMFTLSVQA